MSENSWIGVDLDRTLAHYDEWDGGKIGEPIPAMLKRVKAWLADGIEVRIVTARANPKQYATTSEWLGQMLRINAWLNQNVGQCLDITCEKDFQMIELWDDRAVQVEANTGRVLGEPRVLD